MFLRAVFSSIFESSSTQNILDVLRRIVQQNAMVTVPETIWWRQRRYGGAREDMVAPEKIWWRGATAAKVPTVSKAKDFRWTALIVLAKN